MRIDLFCRVIDNWGDAGVCWRLARQLVRERGAQVRLWIDQPQVLAAWQDERAALTTLQICTWSDAVNWSEITPADAVIEAFACDIPADYVRNMAQAEIKPRWLNLEYLSAEAWVEGAHLLPSPQSGGLTKLFFFPGFTEKTGGLLRERDLLTVRDRFVAQYPRYWSDLTGFEWVDDVLAISLFGYEDMPLQAWLPALIEGETPVQLAVTYGKASEALKRAWSALNLPQSNAAQWHAGQLSVRFLPMLSQGEYDQLLWSADINMVRGEDSLVRALWAGKPLVWDIYKQNDGVHWDKLKAFTQRYGASGDEGVAQLNDAFTLCWNDSQVAASELTQQWLRYVRAMPALTQHARDVAAHLAQQDDLVTQLLRHLSVAEKP